MSPTVKKAEILAPAGSFDSVVAACRCGADAVYLGAKSFSARASAQNFSIEELSKTVSFCHERGVKVYLTLNTSLYDKEFLEAAKLIENSAKLSVDALIISDLGVLSLCREICPDMPLHASTQMSIQSAEGVREAKRLGFERAVLAREMSREEIFDAVKNGGIETEAFVHGALCMSVSGQCYLSSVLGKRSGNRGRCAQPCRLDFGLENASYVLSLKDLSLSSYLKELDEIGVTSFKIEGRMKRPEYVAAAVSLVRASLLGNEDGEIKELSRSIFSRSGFTDGYFTSNIDKSMFGYRNKDDVDSSKEAIPRLHELYRRENPRVAVNASLTVCAAAPITLELNDEQGNSVSATAPAPEFSQNSSLTQEQAKEKISKLGSTPYYLNKFNANIQENLFVPASVLNNLRREAAEKLSEIRGAIKPLRTFEPSPLEKIEREKTSQKLYARFENVSQIGDNENICDKIILPYRELLLSNKRYSEKYVAELDRCSFSNDVKIERALCELKEKGIKWVCVQNISQIESALKNGFEILSGAFMNIYNSRALKVLSQRGVCEAVASFELSSKSLANLNPCVNIGALAYGYLPLMITRACPVKNIKNCKTCQGKGAVLRDRMGKEMSVKCRGTVSEIYNCVPLVAPIEEKEFENLGFLLAYFTSEDSKQISEILKYIKLKKSPECPNGFTRGLYRGGVI